MRGIFRIGQGILLLCVAFSLITAGSVAAQDDANAVTVISSPIDGQQLFGQVSILGSAQHPSAFANYTLEYNDLSDPNASWLPVQPPVRQQIADDILGSWNTTLLPDGTYRLRLRLIRQDGQTAAEFTVTGLRVVNSQPTPIPAEAGGALNAGPTPGPSPTSPIFQPPASNAEAGPLSALGASSESSTVQNDSRSLSASTRINTGRVRGAFCTGVYLTVIVFAFMLFYRVIRGRLRPYTRRLWWQFQDEIQDES